MRAIKQPHHRAVNPPPTGPLPLTAERWLNGHAIRWRPIRNTFEYQTRPAGRQLESRSAKRSSDVHPIPSRVIKFIIVACGSDLPRAITRADFAVGLPQKSHHFARSKRPPVMCGDGDGASVRIRSAAMLNAIDAIKLTAEPLRRSRISRRFPEPSLIFPSVKNRGRLKNPTRKRAARDLEPEQLVFGQIKTLPPK